MFSHSFFNGYAFSPSYFPPNGGIAPLVFGPEGDYAWDVFSSSERLPVFPVPLR